LSHQFYALLGGHVLKQPLLLLVKAEQVSWRLHLTRVLHLVRRRTSATAGSHAARTGHKRFALCARLRTTRLFKHALVLLLHPVAPFLFGPELLHFHLPHLVLQLLGAALLGGLLGLRVALAKARRQTEQTPANALILRGLPGPLKKPQRKRAECACHALSP
jgi:hypothetical protein